MFFADFDHYIPKQKIALSLLILAVVNAPGKFYSIRKLRRGQPKGRKFITVGLLFKSYYVIRL